MSGLSNDELEKATFLTMKLIIAGSRNLHPSRWVLSRSLLEFPRAGEIVDEILVGGADGVDICAEEWAVSRRIPVRSFFPDWDTHGKKAGPIRNGQMVREADGLIAFWDGVSRGTANVISQAKNKGIPILVYKWTVAITRRITRIDRPIERF
jgi:hypothetical protein